MCVTEAKKHLPIQTLQNVHNTNIINDCARVFFNFFKFRSTLSYVVVTKGHTYLNNLHLRAVSVFKK